jgi:cytochrome c-type biogenesis protein CcmH
VIWIIFAAMVGLTLLVLLRPLLAAPAAAIARSDYDLMVYKDQLAELARDMERGLLTADQADAARTEILRRMLAASDGDKGGSTVAVKKGKTAPILVALLVPLLGVPVYLLLGAPQLPDRPYAGRAEQIAEMNQRAATIQAMVSRLAERLRQDPSDGKGWAMLGRSYRALGQADEAKEAYRRAIVLLPADTQARIELAIMLLEEAEGDGLPDEAIARLEEVLALAPDQPDALYFTGLSAAMKGDAARAKARWNRLLMVLPADSPARGQVEKDMARLGG